MVELKRQFKAKVSKKATIYHFWRTTDTPGLFAAICNPGLTRAKSELHEADKGERLCKVCHAQG